MKKPVLVIMAAGMGSRFGGLKQIEPVGSAGEIILDFSLYDAAAAGFEKAVFIIKRENEQDFRRLIDDRAGRHIAVEYAFQELDDLPAVYSVPAGRVKPWGTGHAVLAARRLPDGSPSAAADAPFAVINADDYYGPEAFRQIYDFLSAGGDDDKYRYCMVGYNVENTLTENGHVSRGVCRTSADGFLESITERTKIRRCDDQIVFADENGASHELAAGTAVSMNFWGFTPSMLHELAERFPGFLDKALAENPQKGEYFLPSVVDELIHEGKARVQVLKSQDRWYGVTYKEDKDGVVSALQAMKDAGCYPQKLW